MVNWKECEENATMSISASKLKEKEKLEKIIHPMIKQRETLGLTQEKLAELSGCSKAYIADFEAMKTMPSISILLELLDILKMKFVVSVK